MLTDKFLSRFFFWGVLVTLHILACNDKSADQKLSDAVTIDFKANTSVDADIDSEENTYKDMSFYVKEGDTNATVDTGADVYESNDVDLPIEQYIDEILSQMDGLSYDDMVEIKCDQLRPINEWETKTVTVNGLTIPGFRYCDGPRGVGENTTPAANGYAAGKATSFPTRINQSYTWNTELIEEVNKAMSEEFIASGSNVILNASVDLVRDPRVGRVQETVGEDPYLAGKIGVATVNGTQSTGAIANIKHYNLNYMETGRGMMLDYWMGHVNNYTIDQRTLIEHYGIPFKMSIQEGNAMSIMAAYNEINGEKCTENDNLLSEILKDQWGFKYWVVSDWTANVSGYKAFNAGLDCDESFIFPSLYQQYLESDVKEGKITMETLDESVRRVLRSKLESGIMDYYNQYDSIDIEVINSPEHQELAKKAALESIILLENKNEILPLNKADYNKIAVIGPNADKNDVLLGDGSSGSSYVDAAYQVTVFEGISNKVGADKVDLKEGCLIKNNPLLDPFYMSDALSLAKQSDLVVFVGGINFDIEGEGNDRYDWTIDLPGKQLELINSIKEETGKPVIVVLLGGGAMSVVSFVDNVDALVMAGYPGMEGGNAVADILFGDYNPNAKLTMTFPYDEDQMPDLGAPGDEEFDFSNDIIDGVGYRYYDKFEIKPQYAFGYGLSYTTFELSNLKINNTPAPSSITIDADSLPLKVSFDITNTGQKEGAEVVQLYMSWDDNCSVPMPKKQLKGFKKVNLLPNETKNVDLYLTEDELSFYDINTKTFIVESGQYEIMIGNSSDNLSLHGSFQYQ